MKRKIITWPGAAAQIGSSTSNNVQFSDIENRVQSFNGFLCRNLNLHFKILFLTNSSGFFTIHRSSESNNERHNKAGWSLPAAWNEKFIHKIKNILRSYSRFETTNHKNITGLSIFMDYIICLSVTRNITTLAVGVEMDTFVMPHYFTSFDVNEPAFLIWNILYGFSDIKLSTIKP